MVETILLERGFQRVGQSDYGLPFLYFWNAEQKIHLTLCSLSDCFILSGSKEYAVIGQASDGRQTFVQDLPGLLKYLESHFPECHLYLGFYREITPQIIPGYKEIAAQHHQLRNLKNEMNSKKGILESSERRKRMLERTAGFDHSRDLVEKRVKAAQRQLSEDKATFVQLQKRLAKGIAWLKEYEQKGNASTLMFRYATVPYVATEENFDDVVSALTKDVIDTHHFSIRQKLQGGQLQVYVREVEHPHVMQLGLYATLAPRHWQRLSKQLPEIDQLEHQIRSYLIPTLSEDASVEGHRAPAHRIPAMAFREFLKRADEYREHMSNQNYPTEGQWIGHVMEGNAVTSTPFLFPIEQLIHGYCSGTTSSGKSYLATVLVENALIQDINVIILDPTGTWTGLAKPNQNEKVLQRFEQLDVSRDHTMGFNLRIYTPDRALGLKLPQDPKQLLKGCSLFDFKGASKETQLTTARDILQTVYESMRNEYDGLKQLVVIEETQAFLQRKASPDLKPLAKELSELIDSIAREGRKYGVNLLLLTQSLADFSHTERVVREMINSRFFLRATDKAEHDFIESYVSNDAVDIVKQLGPGEVLIHSPAVPLTKVFVRPTFSQVGSLTDGEIRAYCQGKQSLRKDPSKNQIEPASLESRILEAANRIYGDTGHYPKVRELAAGVGLTSGGKIKRLIDQMEDAGLIRTENIGGRGNPRIVIPLNQ